MKQWKRFLSILLVLCLMLTYMPVGILAAETDAAEDGETTVSNEEKTPPTKEEAPAQKEEAPARKEEAPAEKEELPPVKEDALAEEADPLVGLMAAPVQPAEVAVTVTVNAEGLTYTGQELTPSLVVKAGDVILTKGTDYDCRYSSNITPGENRAYVTVFPMENGPYTFAETRAYFSIGLAQLTGKVPDITVSLADARKGVKPDFSQIKTVDEYNSLSGQYGPEGNDYSILQPLKRSDAPPVPVEYKYHIDANHHATLEGSFLVTVLPFNTADLVVEATGLQYNGEPQKPVFTVYGNKDKTAELIEGRDYMVECAEQTDPGTYQAIIKPVPRMFNLKGDPITVDWSIGKVPVTPTFTVEDKVYDGTANGDPANVQVQSVTGMLDGDQAPAIQVTAVQYDNGNAGDRTATITATVDSPIYTLPDTMTAQARITPKDLTVTAKDISVGCGETPVYACIYEGLPVTAQPPVVTYTCQYDPQTARPGDTFPITPSSEDGNYIITAQNGTLTVVKAKAQVTLTPAQVTYDGAAHPLITGADVSQGCTISYSLDGTNYSETVPEGTNAGPYTVYYQVSGTETYEAVQDKITVTIRKAAPQLENFVFEADQRMAYNGQEQYPVVTLASGIQGMGSITVTTRATHVADNKNLKDSISFDVAEGDNYTAGSFTAPVTFRIQARTLESVKVQLSQTTYMADGTPKEPAVTVTEPDGTVIAADSYAVSYQNNSAAGEAAVQVKEAVNGDYTFAPATATFQILAPDAVKTENIQDLQNQKAELEQTLKDEPNNTKAQEALDQVNAALKTAETVKTAADSQAVKDTKTVTAETVIRQDSANLQQAQKDLETALANKSFLTEEQAAALTAQQTAVAQAIAVLAPVEAAAAAIPAALPETADPTVSAESETQITEACMAFEAAYQGFTDQQKALAAPEHEKLEALRVGLVAYKTTVNPTQNWAPDGGSATFTFNGRLEKFVKLLVNGKEVDPANYEKVSGSTIITLKPEYLKTLGSGEFIFEPVYADSDAKGALHPTAMIAVAPYSEADRAEVKKNVDYINGIDEKKVNADMTSAIDAAVAAMEDLTANGKIPQADKDLMAKAIARAKELKEVLASVAQKAAENAEALKAYSVDTVKSSDDLKKEITDPVNAITELLKGENLSKEQRKLLETVEAHGKALLKRIQDAAAARNTKDIQDVAGVHKNNVQFSHKQDLLEAQKDLKHALEAYEKNYTEEELKSLKQDIDRVDAALNSIYRAERAIWLINKLPKELTDGDNRTMRNIMGAKLYYDQLTSHEQSLVGGTRYQKLMDLYNSFIHYEVIPLIEKEQKQDVTFRVSGDPEKFVELRIGDAILTDQDYTMKKIKDDEGSPITEIVLKDAFLNTLKKQRYSIEVDYTDGIAVGSIYDRQVSSTWIPRTGDSFDPGLWMIRCSISAAAMACLVFKKKKTV